MKKEFKWYTNRKRHCFTLWWLGGGGGVVKIILNPSSPIEFSYSRVSIVYTWKRRCSFREQLSIKKTKKKTNAAFLPLFYLSGKMNIPKPLLYMYKILMYHLSALKCRVSVLTSTSNKRPMADIAYLRKQDKSINTFIFTNFFRNCLPLEIVVVLNLNELEFLSSKDNLWRIRVKLTSWFLRKF